VSVTEDDVTERKNKSQVCDLAIVSLRCVRVMQNKQQKTETRDADAQQQRKNNDMNEKVE
jgi:hypothetical protein